MTKKQIIILSIILAVIIALGFWVKSRMNAWFHNPEEPSFSAITEPSRILFTFGNDGEQSRLISWRYDSVVSPSFVELVANDDTILIEANVRQIESLGGKSVYYQAKLNDLAWNTTYQYRLNHAAVKSKFFSFTMPDTTSPDFSFTYMGDIQDTIQGIFPEILQQIYEKTQTSDFYLFGGDLIERPHDQYWNEFFKSIDFISHYIPIVATPGNHEYIKGIINRLEKRFTFVFPYYRNVAGEDNHVFTFKYKQAQFFLLDSNNGLINLFKQRRWLRNELKKSDASWKIVVLHHPIYSIRGKFNNLFVRLFFNPIVKKYNVDLVLQGHEHGYARTTNENNTTPLYIISHNSPKVYRHKLNEKIQKYEKGGRYYQQIDVKADSLQVATFDFENNSIDWLIIDRKGNVRCVN